jgi:hypothetical protein
LVLFGGREMREATKGKRERLIGRGTIC